MSETVTSHLSLSLKYLVLGKDFHFLLSEKINSLTLHINLVIDQYLTFLGYFVRLHYSLVALLL